MLPDTYLSIQQNQKGSFVSWLEELGLKDLINRYSLPKLLEWGWLVPQYRLCFPAEYFEEITPENLLNTIADHSRDNDPFYRLLGYGESWHIEDTENPHWFLHPFCRPDSDYNNLLNQTDNSATSNIGYFYHWQAYALIDVVRTANMGIFPILNTPDITQDIARIANCEIKPSNVLNQPHRWGGLAKPMTWLSHYRAFREALPIETDRSLHKKGAEALAEYLEIDAEILEKAIKEQLLEGLTGSWLGTNYDCDKWTLPAWPYLQKDIFFAMEWLCTLNGKNFSDYFKKWPFSHERKVWPPLHKVLPFEYFEDRQYFLCTLPHYKRFYKDIFPTDTKLEQLISRLQKPSFDSLLNAFRQFHEHLMYNPKQKGSLDFRVLRPLDYYSLLAIRAESCFRDALHENDSLANIEYQGLSGYIEELAKQRGISSRVIEYFKGNATSYTQLRDMPENPIDKIMNIKIKKWSKKDTHLVQAFLCCLLARNYFAHHTYLDKEFMRNQKEESAFMLMGILVTVLKLLDY